MTTQVPASAEASPRSFPISPDELEHIRPEEYDADTDSLLFLVLHETRGLRKRIDDIETKADEMMSPDAMMKMAEGFLGKP